MGVIRNDYSIDRYSDDMGIHAWVPFRRANGMDRKKALKKVKCLHCGRMIEDNNFCPMCGKRIRKPCYCWALKKYYDCGYSKCPGFDLYMEFISTIKNKREQIVDSKSIRRKVCVN